ncbi:MAG: hypothetical protein RMK31_05465 [Candidatus Caldarchaeum sp.]|nr:hypothetical protein [Candidatus Caldarchaeum sp.]
MGKYSTAIKKVGDYFSVAMRLTSLTSGAAMAALALVLAVLQLSFPFPPVPYLRFDPAEIPVFTALLGFGPASGFLAAVIYYLALLAVGEFTPVGPTLKFLAVFSSIMGFWAGSRLVASRGMKTMVGFGSVVGTVVRVVILTAANYVVLAVMFPEFLSFATMTLSAFLGFSLSSDFQGLLFVLFFTALFNIIHMVFSLLPSLAILNSIHKARALEHMWVPWVVRASKPRER